MTAHHIKIFAPVEVQEPRGAAWAAAAAVSIGQGLRWLTRRLQGPRPAAPATELPRWQSKSARWAESRALTPALGDVAMSAGFVPGGRWAQLAAWWARATLAIAHRLTGLMAFGTTREAGVAACAAWAFRTVRRLLRRLVCWGRDEPRTAEDMLALARSVEHVSPSFAAELRFFAMNQPDARRALEAHGCARAWREIPELADRCEPTQPDLARQLRAANRYIACG